jgi:uncharacterized membrane protein YfcA
METPFEIVIILVAGFLCGFFNTVASSGSAVTLPLLIFLGLPPAIASGTNRLPVVLGSFIASITFIRAGVINFWLAIKIVLPSLLGGIFGTLLVGYISSDHLQTLIVGAVILALILLFTSVKEALEKTFDEPPRYRYRDVFYLFLVGTWMGLIVLDGATYMLMLLVLSMRFHLPVANGYKNIIMLVVSSISLVILAFNNQIDWKIGGVLAAGSALGGYIGARFAMHELAKKWTFRLLVAIIFLELAHILIMYSTGTMMSTATIPMPSM